MNHLSQLSAAIAENCCFLCTSFLQVMSMLIKWNHGSLLQSIHIFVSKKIKLVVGGPFLRNKSHSMRQTCLPMVCKKMATCNPQIAPLV